MDYIKINNKTTFPTELAITAQEQEIGLMNRDVVSIPMSFVYSEPRVNKFWMLNTRQPLNIVFCLNNRVVNICKGSPYSLDIIGNDEPSDLVVEFPLNIGGKLNIKPNDEIKLFFSPNSLKKFFNVSYGLLK